LSGVGTGALLPPIEEKENQQAAGKNGEIPLKTTKSDDFIRGQSSLRHKIAEKTVAMKIETE
jgi:hypothetical protein